MEIIRAKNPDVQVHTEVGLGRNRRPMPIKEIGLRMEYSKDIYSIGEPIIGKGFRKIFYAFQQLELKSEENYLFDFNEITP